VRLVPGEWLVVDANARVVDECELLGTVDDARGRDLDPEATPGQGIVREELKADCFAWCFYCISFAVLDYVREW